MFDINSLEKQLQDATSGKFFEKPMWH